MCHKLGESLEVPSVIYHTIGTWEFWNVSWVGSGIILSKIVKLLT